MSHRPPKNDRERLQNLIEALAEPGDGDDAFDEAMRAELAKRGLTLETWAAEMQARAQATLERSRRARRVRAAAITAGVAVGLAAAAGVVLALLHGMRGMKQGADVEQSIRSAIHPDAGRAAPPRR